MLLGIVLKKSKKYLYKFFEVTNPLKFFFEIEIIIFDNE